MRGGSLLTFALTAFLAGCIAVAVFHQGAVAALNAAGMMPGGIQPWSFDPVPPFGVPTVISKAFWGGVWAVPLGLLLRNQTGPAYWVSWTVLGGVALSLVAIFIVPTLKGQPMPVFMERFPIYAGINAAWGFGTAMILRMLD